MDNMTIDTTEQSFRSVWHTDCNVWDVNEFHAAALLSRCKYITQ